MVTLRRVGGRLGEPVDAASLAAFRILFGALMVAAAARFFVHGWIGEYYEEPRVFFPYWGAGWVRPWPPPFMHVHYAAMGLAAAALMVGLFYRVSAAMFVALFTYAHLTDKTNYLNHYYLVTLLGLLLVALPAGQTASIDGWWRAKTRHIPPRASVPLAAVAILRFQVGVVYFFGGVAKLRGDWLLHAQPLTIWLSANADFPLLGSLFRHKAAAQVMSVAGAAFDLSVPFLLLGRRTRPFAYGALVAFHVITARLFQLGLFPWIMSAAALVFFSPSWPRRVPGLRRLLPSFEAPGGPEADTPPGLPTWACWALAAWCAVQVFVPLRRFFYPGNLLWTEEGYRFSWNVMLMEKDGTCDLTVRDPSTGRAWLVDNREYLTRYQAKMMATQPDMILQYAHLVAEDFRLRRGVAAPQVFARAEVTLNGRPPALLVDPNVDLAQERDGLARKRWILPTPLGAPEF